MENALHQSPTTPRWILAALALTVATSLPPIPAVAWAAQNDVPDAITRPAPTDTLVKTADGATIALRRYAAPGPPVLLVHGISSNHRTWDLSEDRSLARTLQAQGFDAWLLDLRGHGLAERDAQGHRQRQGWNIDDYGVFDIPAAIEHIRDATGATKLACVGHSLGGMVAAIYVASFGDDALSALVVVGSPVDFSQPEPLLIAARNGASLAALSPTLATPTLAHIASWLRRSPAFIDALLFSSDNLDRDARKQIYQAIVSPLSRGELRQLRMILATGRFTSMDGQVDYLDRLSTLHAPLLVIAGRGDRIAPVDRVAPFYSRAQSPQKRLVVASRANGFCCDYGHLDLALGDHAPTEIYPLITGWLRDHPPTAARSAPANPQQEQAGEQPQPADSAAGGAQP